MIIIQCYARQASCVYKYKDTTKKYSKKNVIITSVIGI